MDNVWSSRILCNAHLEQINFEISQTLHKGPHNVKGPHFLKHFPYMLVADAMILMLNAEWNSS